MANYETIEEFCEGVLSQVELYLPDRDTKKYSLKLENEPYVNRNTLIIHEGNKRVSSVIYLDDFYAKWKDREYMTFRSVLKDISETYKHHGVLSNLNISNIPDFENLKSKIVRRVISVERNQMLLENVPYTPCEDLAVVYRIETGENVSNGVATSIALDNKLLEHFPLSLEELDRIARENTRRIYQPIISTVAEAMFAFAKEYIMDTFRVDEAGAWEIFCATYETPNDSYLYIGNKVQCFGAVSILDENVQDEISDKLGERYCVIPVSVHEVIAFPFDGFYDTLKVYEPLIQEKNNTVLRPSDVLSSKMYMVDARNHVLLKADRAEDYFKEIDGQKSKREEDVDKSKKESELTSTLVETSKKHRIL